MDILWVIGIAVIAFVGFLVGNMDAIAQRTVIAILLTCICILLVMIYNKL